MIAAGDVRLKGPGAHRTLLRQRGFTEPLPGQFYQGITNGYDMICLASLPIKAGWGNGAAPHLTEAQQCSVNVDYCLSYSFQWRSKFHCDYHKGKWPLARPIRYVVVVGRWRG